MNAVGQQSYPRRHYTVAELLAREASGVRTPYHRERQATQPRAPLSVTDLLRREGVGFAGENHPTIELPTSAPLHVTKLLQRESEQTEPEQKRRSHRIAAAGSAAALCGLTIAGLIALKPTFASSPGGLADDPTQPAGSSPSQADTIKPTTTVLHRANSKQASTGQAESTAPAQGGAQDGSSTAAQRPAATSDAPAAQPTTEQPAPKTTEPSDRKPGKPTEKPHEDDPTGGLLDPITEPVGKALDPVVGTVTGTLDGLLG